MIRQFLIAILFLLTSCFWVAGVRAASGAAVKATATATVAEDVIIVSQQSLNFGFITPSTTGGTVTVSPNNQRSETGGVQTSLSFSPATFAVRGKPGHSYSIHTPTALTFFVKRQGSDDGYDNAVEKLTVKDFVTYSTNAAAMTTTGQLDGTGQDWIYLGATLVVPANAAAGIYSGQVPLTVSY